MLHFIQDLLNHQKKMALKTEEEGTGDNDFKDPLLVSESKVNEDQLTDSAIISIKYRDKLGQLKTVRGRAKGIVLKKGKSTG